MRRRRDLSALPDYTSILDKDGLRGARIGVRAIRKSRERPVYYGALPRAPPGDARCDVGAGDRRGHAGARQYAVDQLDGGPGTDAAILNLNPESATRNQRSGARRLSLRAQARPQRLPARLWAKGTPMHTMADIIAFNAPNAARTLRFGQDIFLASEASQGGLKRVEYVAADVWTSAPRARLGIDAYMDEHSSMPFCFRAIWRSVARKGRLSERPGTGRMIAGIGAIGTPDYPFGATSRGAPGANRCSAPRLCVRAGHQGAQDAAGVPPLEPGCGAAAP